MSNAYKMLWRGLENLTFPRDSEGKRNRRKQSITDAMNLCKCLAKPVLE